MSSTERDTVQALRAALTQNERLSLLKDEQFVFDFFNASGTVGADGKIVTASIANFPAVVGNGMAMAVGLLEPCGMNTPHTHPRAAEMLFSINGTITSGFISENGARFVDATIPAGSAMIYPAGSIHFQQNQGCDTILFVSGLNNEDPGVDSIAQNYIGGLPAAFVDVTLGGIGVQEVAELASKIPDNPAFGTDECLIKCGITRPLQPTAQQRTPIATPSSSAHSSGSAVARRHFVDPPQDVSVMAGGNITHATLVSLVGIMAIGYLVIGVLFAMRRSSSKSHSAATQVRALPQKL